MESENQYEENAPIQTVEERPCPAAHQPLTWTPEALTGLFLIPDGFMREMTQKRVEVFARKKQYRIITPEVMQEKFKEWGMKSEGKERTLNWSPAAQERMMRIPSFIRESVAEAMEGYAKTKGLDQVTEELLEEAKGQWGIATPFHPKGS